VLTTDQTRNIQELQQPQGKWPGPVTYSFLQFVPSYYAAAVGGFSSVNSATQDAVLRAIAEMRSVCNVDFVQVEQTPTTVGDVTVGFRATNLSGYTQPRGSGEGSDVWLPPRSGSSTSPYSTILHELLHAIGVSHPVAYTSVLVGENQPVGLRAFEVDPTEQYTVMSYDPSRSGTNNLDADSLQLYDIAVLQYLYGVNATTRTGDDTYEGTASEVRSIWDAGGIDTISAEAATLDRVVIDLRQGISARSMTMRTSPSLSAQKSRTRLAQIEATHWLATHLETTSLEEMETIPCSATKQPCFRLPTVSPKEYTTPLSPEFTSSKIKTTPRQASTFSKAAWGTTLMFSQMTGPPMSS
jgi:hypothetical protein